MYIKPKDIEINPTNIFEFDLLDRQVEIKNLTPMLNGLDGPLVFAINSSWGTGKTTFVKLWRSFLESQGIYSIYCNAWESDYAEDPLIALVSEIDKFVNSKDGGASNKDKWKKAKALLPGIAKSAAVITAKAATLGALELDKEYEKLVSELTGGVVTDLVDGFNVQSVAIESFKTLVAEVLDELGDEQKNLFVFVDELDRCRPTYAIELLERIKHLFDIENVVFVLSTDIEQLSHSVCAVYGNNFEAKKYLQRFIDFDYSLKQPDHKSYIQSLFGSLAINDNFTKRNNNYAREHLAGCCELVSKRFKLTLREINLLMMRVKLILLSIPVDKYPDVPLLVSLLVLREHNKDLYSQYVIDVGIANEVIDYLGQDLSDEDKIEPPFCLMSGFLIAPNDRERYQELISPYENITPEEDHSNSEIVRAAKMLIRVAENPRSSSMGVIDHKTTVERIELLHRINIDL